LTYGLVLGAGGRAGGAFHRGVVRALSDLGLDARTADVLVGTSAGSVMAASLRQRAPSSALPEPMQAPVQRRRLPGRAQTLELVRRPREVFNGLLLRQELGGGRTFEGFFRGEPGGMAWPKAPTWLAAVRRSDGRRVVFGKPGEPVTDISSAVAASCAIPGYFASVEIDGTGYVDGGVHSPTNADLLADSGLDVIVVSSPLSVQPRGARPRLDLGIRLLFAGYLREELLVLRRRGTRVLTVEPDASVLTVMGLNMMDGRRGPEVEERAHALALRRLEKLPVDAALRPHAGVAR
jgi:NTE family protein